MIYSLFLSLLLAAPSFGQSNTEAAAGTREFTGGLNQVVDPVKLAPGFSPDMMNVLVDEKIGAIVPRKGFTECGVTPSGNAATRLYEYVKVNGTRRLIVSDNAKVWQTADCDTFTEVATGLADNIPDFTTVRDDLWIVNRDTHVIVWDGTTATPLDARASTPNPAPPKCAYLEFWRERVWCARTSTAPSDIAFSALTDSAGNDITPSTGTESWPATNVISVDQDGGCPIYGIKAYQDNLYVFKGRCGVFRIDFENDFNNAVTEVFSSVGAKFHTGVVEGDGLLHFVGPDGIYVTDMRSQPVRISETIPDTFNSLRQPSAAEGFSSWTSQSDFEHADAVIFQATTTAFPGSVSLSTSSSKISNGDAETGDLTNFSFECDISTVARDNTGPWVEANTRSAIEGSYGFEFGNKQASPGTTQCSANFIVDGSTVASISYDDQSDTHQTVATNTLDTSGYVGQTGYLNFWVSGLGTCNIYSDNLTAGTAITYQIQTDCTFGGSASRGIEKLDNIQVQEFSSSGTFTSEIRDLGVTISSHSTFDANTELNGGAVSFMVRVGTNANGVNNTAWSDIEPGDIIDGTTDQVFIQWTATMTYSAPGPIKINDVTFNHLTGDFTDAPIYAGYWKNRFWVSGATGTSTTNNIVLVKSRAPSLSLVPFDMQINDMARFNDNFYVAAATHSSIYRADFGTTDNGAPIQWHYTTPEYDFGQPHMKKTLKEILVEYRKGSASNTKIGYRRNDQTGFTESTKNLNSTGRETVQVRTNGGISHGFQIRVRNLTADETAEILGIGAFAMPGRRRE